MNRITWCGKSDTGRKRRRNEDSFAVDAEQGFFVVADGMGGHAGGDIASTRAVETTREFLNRALSDNEITWPFGIDENLPHSINVLSSAIRLANRDIFSKATGMGTTMVALLVKNGKAYLCHVGDSRIYRIRNGKIEQLTDDHSLVADELRRGAITREQAKTYAMRHVITRAIGTNQDVVCDSRVEELQSGDVFLLCTDGLSGMVDDEEILEIIAGTATVSEACDRLISRANENGGDDNITAVVAAFR